MKNGKYFSWDEVKQNRDQIDWVVYPTAMEFAKEMYLNGAKSCPKCGESPENLFWFGIQSSNESWDRGEGKAGFLTICEKCNLQVDFFRDEELENAIKEGKVRL